MNFLTSLAAAALVLAALPAAMIAMNLAVFRRLPPRPDADSGAASSRGPLPRVSVLIPARDEEAGIEAAVRSVLASRGVGLEVLVLDDHSRDRTAAVVGAMAKGDPRVMLHPAPPLPPGWNGKQHACHRLAEWAGHDTLVWIDADVRLEPDTLARMVRFQRESGASLISGFPRQVTQTPVEALVVPLIQVVLLGYLPIAMMRLSRSPGFGAGCGQLFMAERQAYFAIASGGDERGGHASIRGSMHDGVTLPRAFRDAGLATDLFDATDAAACRMYRGAAQVWRGFAKNATEGLASTRGLVPWTVLLLGGWVLPWVLGLASGWGRVVGGGEVAMWEWLAWAGCGVSLAGSVAVAWRCGQGWVAAAGRPLGVAILVAIQWHAALRRWRGKPATWRGRPYIAGG